MVIAAAQKLVREGAVAGKVQNNVFTPQVHSDAEGAKFESFFHTNQYIPFQMAKSCGVNLKEWVQAQKVSGLHLSSLFISDQILEPLIASLGDNLALPSSGWVDLQALLPPVCTPDDAKELLRVLASQKKLPAEASVFERTLVSNNFIKSLSSDATFDSEVQKAANKLLNGPATKAGGAKKASAAPPMMMTTSAAAARSEKGRRQQPKERRARTTMTSKEQRRQDRLHHRRSMLLSSSTSCRMPTPTFLWSCTKTYVASCSRSSLNESTQL